MDYTNLPQKKKDRIYNQLQRIKLRKSLVRNRSFYNKEDYVPVPMCDISKIMKSLNSCLTNPELSLKVKKNNPDFLYDFLSIIEKATSQGIEDEIPKDVQDFYNAIVLPAVTSGKLKTKVQSLLSNLHDPLFTNDKAYNWMRLDYPEEVCAYDYEMFPTAMHFYYAEICSDQRLREQIKSLGTVQELQDFIRGAQKRGIKFKHDFYFLTTAFWIRLSYEPYRTMLVNTGDRPICYIDKDSYFDIVIRNNGTPAPYLQTAYHNLKIGQNKAGQALMQVRYELSNLYALKPRRKNEKRKPCAKKRAAVKTFLKKTALQMAA